jgi:hypothetical protein
LCIGLWGSLVLGEFFYNTGKRNDGYGILASEYGGNREEAKLLTKGDNNLADDTELYAKGQDYIERKDIIGSVFAYIPFVGYVTILLSGHPWLKTVMLGLMGLSWCCSGSKEDVAFGVMCI